MKSLIQRQFDFMGKRRLAFAVSAVMLLVSIASLLIQGLNLGLDFTGGTLVEVRYATAPALDGVRQILEAAGFQDVAVQTFGASTEVLVRLQQAFEAGVGDRVVELLARDGARVELVRAEFVGAQVGDQLRDKGGMGMLVALGIVMLYVAFRFQYKFAIGALLALIHDVIIVVGAFSLFGFEFDLTVLAAVLAVIGYSLNDTIVVFDRIRENLKAFRREGYEEVVNRSINETLSRTLLTSLTTMIVVLALFFLGGEVIHDFAFALLVGVAVGTYSSVFVASPVLVFWQRLMPSKKRLAVGRSAR